MFHGSICIWYIVSNALGPPTCIQISMSGWVCVCVFGPLPGHVWCCRCTKDTNDCRNPLMFHLIMDARHYCDEVRSAKFLELLIIRSFLWSYMWHVFLFIASLIYFLILLFPAAQCLQSMFNSCGCRGRLI